MGNCFVSVITSSSTLFLVPGLTLVCWLPHVDADWHDGWDALQTAAALLPDPPPEPAGAQNRTSWQWDGQNGNNGVWFGNTKAGVRLELKGGQVLQGVATPPDRDLDSRRSLARIALLQETPAPSTPAIDRPSMGQLVSVPVVEPSMGHIVITNRCSRPRPVALTKVVLQCTRT
jgi:hypothetical protein